MSLISKTSSRIRLVSAIVSNSFWLLTKSLRIIAILNKKMFSCLIKGTHKRNDANGGPNIFNHYGVWFVDLRGLLYEQMEIK